MVGTYNHPQARQGRNGDSMMAHVTPGEQVVPKPVLDANPQLAMLIAHAIRNAGADPSRYEVGKNMSINPKTGKPEFFLGHWFDHGIGRIVKTVAPIVVGAFNPALGAAVGAGLGAGNGGGILGGVTGAASGYFGGSALNGAVSGFSSGLAGAPIAGTVGPQAGGLMSGFSGALAGAGAGMTGAGSALGDALGISSGTVSAASKVLQAASIGSSLMGGQKQLPQQQALAQQKIGDPTSPSPLTRPDAIARPQGLSPLADFSPEQERSALATQGVNRGLGDEEQAYYRNLVQRSLIGDGGKINTDNPNFLSPIESQYFSRQGQNTSDVTKFLRGLQA